MNLVLPININFLVNMIQFFVMKFRTICYAITIGILNNFIWMFLNFTNKKMCKTFFFQFHCSISQLIFFFFLFCFLFCILFISIKIPKQTNNNNNKNKHETYFFCFHRNLLHKIVNNFMSVFVVENERRRTKTWH